MKLKYKTQTHKKQLNLFDFSFLSNKQIKIKYELLMSKRLILYNKFILKLQKYRNDKEMKKYIVEKYKSDVSFIDEELSEIYKEYRKRFVK